MNVVGSEGPVELLKVAVNVYGSDEYCFHSTMQFNCLTGCVCIVLFLWGCVCCVLWLRFCVCVVVVFSVCTHVVSFLVVCRFKVEDEILDGLEYYGGGKLWSDF